MAVAPLAGSVDRNEDDTAEAVYFVNVAPLAGSVDRNLNYQALDTSMEVAPLAGSVDRNRTALYP